MGVDPWDGFFRKLNEPVLRDEEKRVGGSYAVGGEKAKVWKLRGGEWVEEEEWRDREGDVHEDSQPRA